MIFKLLIIITALSALAIKDTMPTPRRFQTGTNSQDVLAGLNQNFDYIDGQERTRIIRNGNTPTILEGYQQGGFGTVDYGFKVAKPGIDVTTAAAKDLAFSSAFNNFKIVSTGTGSFTKSAGNTLGFVNIAHGLGYAPTALVYYGTTTANPLPTTILETTGANAGKISLQVDFATDATYLTINAWSPNYAGNTAFGVDTTITYRYYIIQETAN